MMANVRNPTNKTLMWSLSVREACGDDSVSDNENDPISETALISDFDIKDHKETVECKPNR